MQCEQFIYLGDCLARIVIDRVTSQLENVEKSGNFEVCVREQSGKTGKWINESINISHIFNIQSVSHFLF